MNVTRKDVQYMDMCIAVSQIFSTCAKRKYAAVLVDENGHVIGMGYNGGPKGFPHCEDGGCPRLKENSANGSIYDNCIAIHAEANAIIHSDYSSNPKKIYVNGPPCFSCAKLIANSTITDVYYMSDSSYKNWEEVKTFLSKANVRTHEI
jgi:dCMP deaminase